jgi:hypothetical protein
MLTVKRNITECRRRFDKNPGIWVHSGYADGSVIEWHGGDIVALNTFGRSWAQVQEHHHCLPWALEWLGYDRTRQIWYVRRAADQSQHLGRLLEDAQD